VILPTQCFQELTCGFRIAVRQDEVSNLLIREPNGTYKEKRMSIDVNMAKKAIHDKLESQIKTAEAKLETEKRSTG
jgi:hypothetical protein